MDNLLRGMYDESKVVGVDVMKNAWWNDLGVDNLEALEIGHTVMEMIQRGGQDGMAIDIVILDIFKALNVRVTPDILKAVVASVLLTTIITEDIKKQGKPWYKKLLRI